jgi:hypothetical protein
MHNEKFAQRNFQLNRRTSIRASGVLDRRQSITALQLDRVIVSFFLLDLEFQIFFFKNNLFI